MNTFVYKIEAKEDWERDAASGYYYGSSLDKKDGFIHLSSAGQTPETFRLYFAGIKNLIVAKIDAASLGDALKWEASRGGQLFPHYYGALPLYSVTAVAAVDYSNDTPGLPMELF